MGEITITVCSETIPVHCIMMDAKTFVAASQSHEFKGLYIEAAAVAKTAELAIERLIEVLTRAITERHSVTSKTIPSSFAKVYIGAQEIFEPSMYETTHLFFGIQTKIKTFTLSSGLHTCIMSTTDINGVLIETAFAVGTTLEGAYKRLEEVLMKAISEQQNVEINGLAFACVIK
jgi:hypothetical protein